MKLRLRVIRGPGLGTTAEFTPGDPLVVGRGAQSRLQILDEGLSRTHCRFFWEGADAWVEDLGSKNGTAINGQRLDGRRRVSAGDVVGLGTVDLEVEGAASAPDVAQPTIGFKKRVEMGRSTLFGGQAPGVKDVVRLQRDLATVYKVVELFSTENDLDRLFGLVMDTIMAVTGADRGAALLKADAEGGAGPLRPAATRERGRPAGSAGPLAVSSTIVEEGLKGLSLITADALVDERFRAGASIVSQNIHAAMCVPLESHDKILGVLYVDATGERRRFQESELELLTAIGRQAGIAVQRALYLKETRELFYSTVKTLAATIEAKDRYTRGHSERVTNFSVAIAAQLGLSAEEQQTVRLSALLHDVGKIGVSERVLNKAGKLTDEEYAQIQEHPSLGSRIVQNIPRVGEVLLGVRHHHEKWNGKGYPDHLAGEAIPRIARIISVADAYDAMASHRAYRKGLSEDTILEEIKRGSGVQWDPACVTAFLAALEAGLIPRPGDVLADQVSYQDKLTPPEASDAQGVQAPPDVA